MSSLHPLRLYAAWWTTRRKQAQEPAHPLGEGAARGWCPGELLQGFWRWWTEQGWGDEIRAGLRSHPARAQWDGVVAVGSTEQDSGFPPFFCE